MSSRRWTAIVFTCQTVAAAQAYRHELKLLQKRGLINTEVLLTVEDPKESVGSGGATLNALLVVTEHLGARQGLTVVSAETLKDAHVLIVHLGRSYPFDATSRAFMALPMKARPTQHSYDGFVNNVCLLLDTLSSKLAVNSPPGMWVVSTDMFLNIQHVLPPEKLSTTAVTCISVYGTPEYAQGHGVYKISQDGTLQDIVYQGSHTTIEPCKHSNGLVPLVVGVLYFPTVIIDTLLSMTSQPPLDACTYYGLDSGAVPIQISIFFDLLLALCPEKATSLHQSAGHFLQRTLSNPQLQEMVVNARAALRKHLQNYSAKVVIVDGDFLYLDAVGSTHSRLLRTPPVACESDNESPWILNCRLYSHMQNPKDVAAESVVINSIIGEKVCISEKATMSHCHLVSEIHIGSEAILSGFDENFFESSSGSFVIHDGITMQNFRISLSSQGGQGPRSIAVVLGCHDDLTARYDASGTFCNEPWSSFFERTGIVVDDLWPSNMETKDMCLMNARLFPLAHAYDVIGSREIMWLQGSRSSNDDRMQRWRSSWRLSLVEILSCLDLKAEFAWRRDLFYKIACEYIRESLLREQAQGLPSLYRTGCIEGYHQQLLETLDQVACECDSAGTAARCLGNIADVLGFLADGKGGMRSGPGSNADWQPAFDKLENGDLSGGIQSMTRVRNEWLTRRDYLVRAARHYEGAAQILIRHAVMTAREFVRTSPCDPAPIGRWVIAECPSRVDLSGGWSDTPPITYEHTAGGAVTNVAVKIDGKKPIGAKVRRIPELEVILHVVLQDQQTSKIVISQIQDLADYCKPSAPGALLKASLLCSDVLSYPCEDSLVEQLRTKHGSGFELQSWADLPHGSGLGTSSILAGAIMAALWKASGKTFTTESLVHAVLHIEQVMTTGGGWQDNVGGLVGGIKVGHSKSQFPLYVNINHLTTSAEMLRDLNNQLVLIYTGKTRLARNLLQNVIRSWYGREPDTVSVVGQLVANAWKCAEAIEQGDLAALGRCMDTYWQQKQYMAPGCEPPAVTRMLAALRPHIHGASLAGAGGGGFLYVLMKHGVDAVKRVEEILKNVEGAEHITVHNVSVDEEGIVTRYEDESE